MLTVPTPLLRARGEDTNYSEMRIAKLKFMLATVWAGQAGVSLSDCRAVPVTDRGPWKQKLDRERNRNWNRNQKQNSNYLRWAVPWSSSPSVGYDVPLCVRRHTDSPISPPFQLCRALASEEREEGLCPCSVLAVPPDPRERDRSVPCHIEHLSCNKWTALSAGSASRSPFAVAGQALSAEQGAVHVGSVRRVDSTRNLHGEKGSCFRCSHPTASGSSPGTRGRLRAVGAKLAQAWPNHEWISWNGCDPPAAGRGQKEQKKLVAASSALAEQMRADSGGSPTGTAPRAPSLSRPNDTSPAVIGPRPTLEATGLGTRRLSLPGEPVKATA